MSVYQSFYLVSYVAPDTQSIFGSRLHVKKITCATLPATPPLRGVAQSTLRMRIGLLTSATGMLLDHCTTYQEPDQELAQPTWPRKKTVVSATRAAIAGH